MVTAVSDLLDGLEAAAKAATPGEWTQHGSMIAARGTDTIVDCWEAREDAACIVVEHNAVPVLVAALRRAHDALRLIDRYGCTNYTGGARCIDSSERQRDAEYGADAWCDACIAADALGASS